MDLTLASGIATIVTSAKNVFDLIDRVYRRRAEDPDFELSHEMKHDLEGDKQLAREASATVIQVLHKQAMPFILRIGSNFRLPPDMEDMDRAVRLDEVWDWTYVFGFRGEETPLSFIRHLRALYLDPSNPKLLRKDASTTCLYISQKALPHDLFGDALYIAGAVLTSSAYTHVFHISPLVDIMPRIVIKVAHNEIFAYSDPILMNYFLHKVTDFIFNSYESFEPCGFLKREIKTDEDRVLNHKLLAALGVD